MRLRDRGRFEPPESIVAASRKYTEESDVVLAFLTEVCTLGSDLSEQATPLYKAYREWSLATGRKPQSRPNFKSDLERLKVVQYDSNGRKRCRGAVLREPFKTLTRDN